MDEVGNGVRNLATRRTHWGKGKGMFSRMALARDVVWARVENDEGAHFLYTPPQKSGQIFGPSQLQNVTMRRSVSRGRKKKKKQKKSHESILLTSPLKS
jgi:hypothetical protein